MTFLSNRLHYHQVTPDYSVTLLAIPQFVLIRWGQLGYLLLQRGDTGHGTGMGWMATRDVSRMDM